MKLTISPQQLGCGIRSDAAEGGWTLGPLDVRTLGENSVLEKEYEPDPPHWFGSLKWECTGLEAAKIRRSACPVVKPVKRDMEVEARREIVRGR